MRAGGGAARAAGSSAQRSSDARRGVASAEAEGERGGDRGRAEDQPEREHHDLVGKTHEGQADRGEQGDDRIADDASAHSRLRRCRCRPGWR